MREIPTSRHTTLTPAACARRMTRSRSPSMLSSRVIGRSSQSAPLQGVVTLGTIGQMALFFSSLKCQHYYDSGHPRLRSQPVAREDEGGATQGDRGHTLERVELM